MKRWRLVNAHCNLIRRSPMASHCWRRFIARYNKARSITGKAAFGLAITYARMDRREEARQTLKAATANRRYLPGDAIAHVHVALHEHDAAIRELQRACEERSSSLHMVGIAPEFAPMRSDPRFTAILKRIGLEPEKVFASTSKL